MNVLLVDASSEQTVRQHPEIAARLDNGWTIRRASPRIVERDGAKWLVVLERVPNARSLLPSLGDALPARSRREERVRKRLESAGGQDAPKRPPSGQEH